MDDTSHWTQAKFYQTFTEQIISLFGTLFENTIYYNDIINLVIRFRSQEIPKKEDCRHHYNIKYNFIFYNIL